MELGRKELNLMAPTWEIEVYCSCPAQVFAPHQNHRNWHVASNTSIHLAYPSVGREVIIISCVSIPNICINSILVLWCWQEIGNWDWCYLVWNRLRKAALVMGDAGPLSFPNAAVSFKGKDVDVLIPRTSILGSICERSHWSENQDVSLPSEKWKISSELALKPPDHRFTNFHGYLL